jgi:hypothetical protein
MERRFHPDVERLLREGGWASGRRASSEVAHWRQRLESPAGFVLHDAAKSVLLEFGGLRLGRSGPGVNVGRATLNLDPTLVSDDQLLRDGFPQFRGRSLFPLGEVDGGHALLAVDISGEVYSFMDEVYGHWPTFDAALDGLLRGIRSQAV